MALAEKDELVEALAFDGTNEALGVIVQVGTARGQADRGDAGRGEEGLGAEDCVRGDDTAQLECMLNRPIPAGSRFRPNAEPGCEKETSNRSWRGRVLQAARQEERVR